MNMKLRALIRNGLTVVIISGVMALAIAQFAKSRQNITHNAQAFLLQQQSKRIHRERERNSMMKVRIRALDTDKEANRSLIMERMGLMQAKEVRIAPKEL